MHREVLVDRAHRVMPVMAARRGEGMNELLQAIEDVATGCYAPQAERASLDDPKIEAALDRLLPGLREAFPTVPNLRWVALRLLDNDPSIVRSVREGSLGEVGAPGEMREPLVAAAV